MNYRHAFHAGNHADVLKHILLTRVLDYMRQKDKPFAVLDAHAGIGHYDLSGVEAFKTGEWRDGIDRFMGAQPDPSVLELLHAYRTVLASLNPEGVFRIYPGSPAIALKILRKDDRLILNELHPEDARTLAARFSAHQQVKVTQVDALQSIKTELPFSERRGVVLIDPAFEVADEVERVARMVAQGLHRMAQTVVMAWYPLKSEETASALKTALASHEANGILCCELRVRELFAAGGLAGSGVVVFNPPHTLHAEAGAILPFLARALGQGNWGRGSVSWLKPPR